MCILQQLATFVDKVSSANLFFSLYVVTVIVLYAVGNMFIFENMSGSLIPHLMSLVSAVAFAVLKRNTVN